MTDILEHLPDRYPILSQIKSPADLRALPEETLPELCKEIRSYLIGSLSTNPGHFASSMGAVEIIVAMHYVFDTPRDRVVYDVGHQAYAHKLLTGRLEAFARQRTKGGISGFPTPAESEYDTFMCGHAGNSISAALGMAIADMNTLGEEDRKTVALIGDASISGGLAFEGLNNASNNPNNLLIILNDNEMSIDDNVGALHRYLSSINTSSGYNRMRFRIYNFFRRHGFVNDKRKGLLLRFNNALKAVIAGQQNIFEGLNIRYFGPVDGNDVLRLVKVLRDIKEMKGPRILHLHTVKGHGYGPAENNPSTWHAPGKFDPATGQRQAEIKKSDIPNWQNVFGETLAELAQTRPEIVGITAAMPSGTSMNCMARFPGRYFDVGISEGHAVTFAGGLAAAGKRPFVAIYSSFLQRSFDNIIHDVAIQHLPVTFCIDRAGIVGEDGVTHHGMMDIAYLRMIPGMKVASPMDAATLRNLLFTATQSDGPLAIRYPRGKADTADWKTPMERIEPGRSRILSQRKSAKVAVLSIGPVGLDVVEALNNLERQGIMADHYDMIWAKPLDEQRLLEIASGYAGVVTVEDGVISGGFGSAVAEWMQRNDRSLKVKMLGIPDQWVYQGTVSELRHDCGYDHEGIEKAVKEMYETLENSVENR